MGLSIPRAYRLKNNKNFWKLVADVKTIGTIKVKTALNDFFLQLMGAVESESEEYKKHREGGDSDGVARARIADRLMRDGYKASAVSMVRDPFDFNVRVVFRQWRKRIYVFPYCDMMLHGVLDFLDEDPRLEEFWYDNRGDKPDEIPAHEWRRRAKVWDKFADTPEWGQYLALELCTWDMWWKMNPYYDNLLSGKIRSWGEPPPSSMAELVKAASPKD